jgi:2-polyprenyl-3-methyl-5-hydroxy-6-metoxy-1,4-benzoquinol methylase
MIQTEARAFLEAAYAAVFRRVADQGGLETYTAAMLAGRSATDILREFLASAEFRDALHQRLDDYDAQRDPLLAPFRSAANDALAAELASGRYLEARLFERLHEEACGRGHEPGKEYPRDHLVLHKRRFAELLNAFCFFCRARERPRILDIGNTQNLSWYKAFLPGIELVAADRPDGPEYADADHRVCLDLNTGDVAPLNAMAPYDLIVFTEVLEHLSVNPRVLLEHLIGLLAADGVLYLTTPNFFRLENLARIGRRQNPMPIYPIDNSDRHHHMREYAMAELLAIATEAGGRIRCWYFSDCWDAVPLPPDQRANLVVVVGK